ncbi:DEDD exonuclease domain-containing protein [Dermabacter vaginalis]|uniref:DEDD exonuclease domain-containing protein n=1 Tax=Dermabacter vaginalis TaxID=1630135 RepID=A0ABX6A3W1_9MICO|nr:DEDD exonuclease domain-containing protein [Dermabacter vaginalis]QEU11830.1 DEDD exonuclease domain-containing protein [Dermabacter vaginalis]
MAHVAQRAFEDLGPELVDVEFVVVDLETTGTNADLDAITEIGAVRVVGGEVVEEFQTFVNPERPIPAYIAALTGISDHMVREAPTAEAVIPAFLEFARTSVLVAHNARFDIGFLKAAALRLEYRWPPFEVVDTLALARRVFGRDEVKNHKLSTLASTVGATTVPNHRALSDARATVDVLHGIIARLSTSGASHLFDLTTSGKKATPAQIRKRYLAADIPAVPGVYSFIDAHGSALYIGKSGNLRSRVRTYFSPHETRRAVLDIIPATERIDVVQCSSESEAAVREMRAIARTRPLANRQGVRRSLGNWLRVNQDGLRLARKVHEETAVHAYIGPLRSRHDVEPIRSLVYAALGSAVGSEQTPGSEAGPLESEGPTVAEGPSDRLCGHPGFHARMHRALTEDPRDVFEYAAAKMRVLVERGLYENAEALRTRVELFTHAARRAARLRSIAAVPLIVAARKVACPGAEADTPWQWEIFAVRHGRLGATRTMPAWTDPLSVVAQLSRESEPETELRAPMCFGYHHEAELILEWLAEPGIRIVHIEGEWSMPSTARFTLEEFQRTFTRSATP